MSARNNEERTGAAGSTTPPLDQLVSDQKETTPFEFTTPTEFVDLPSKGKFYTEKHPLHGKDSLEIRYMTAKDEDILTSKSLLKKGLAIDRLLQNIIVDKSIKINELLVGDKNALVVAARVTGYGNEYNTKVSCPACAMTQEYNFDLDDHTLSQGGEFDNAVATGNDTWQITCPKSTAVVEIGLLTGKEEKLLLQQHQKRKQRKLPESSATDQLKFLIKSVNGADDPTSINKFINAMPATDARYVRKAYEKLMPNIDLSQAFECEECGFDMEMEVPFTTDFFWPKQ